MAHARGSRGGELRTLERFFAAPSPDCARLVATAPGGSGLGFVFLETVTDYFTARRHSHLGIIAVTARAEGQGAGSALVAAAEDWARRRGSDRLTLGVFEDNTRARAVYAHKGYRIDTVRYVKMLP